MLALTTQRLIPRSAGTRMLVPAGVTFVNWAAEENYTGRMQFVVALGPCSHSNPTQGNGGPPGGSPRASEQSGMLHVCAGPGAVQSMMVVQDVPAKPITHT